MARKISMIPIFKGELIGAVGASGTALSDVVDLRDVCLMGEGALLYNKAVSGVNGTTGSSLCCYSACATRSGTFVRAGTFATHGVNAGDRTKTFTIGAFPFIKIEVITGTSAPLVFTAELGVR